MLCCKNEYNPPESYLKINVYRFKAIFDQQVSILNQNF